MYGFVSHLCIIGVIGVILSVTLYILLAFVSAAGKDTSIPTVICVIVLFMSIIAIGVGVFFSSEIGSTILKGV